MFQYYGNILNLCSIIEIILNYIILTEPDSKAQPPIVHSHWPLSDPTPAVQLARRERLKMPRNRPCQRGEEPAELGGQADILRASLTRVRC